MDWHVWHPWTALAMLVLGGLAGALVPELIARVREPRLFHAADAARTGLPAGAGQGPVEDTEDPKEPHTAIAVLPGLGRKCAVASALAAGLLGAAAGWSPPLAFLVALVPPGVALAVIDWRTRYLPTGLIRATLAIGVVLVGLSALVEHDLTSLWRAGLGSALAFGGYFVLWLVHPKGMGYGDVRLSAVLGLALGYLGWAELLVGLYAGFLLGGVVGSALAMRKVVDRKAYPFGPFMLVGALVGAVSGGAVLDGLAALGI